MKTATIESAARELALENAASESTIARVYWFPHDSEIRLVEVDTETIKAQDNDFIRPFYFSAGESVPYPSGIALIHPDEVGKRALPKHWGTDWSKGKLLFDREAEGA